MKDIKGAPSLLSADFTRLGEEIKNLEVCGADLFHCDTMDGVFVNNIAFGIKMISDLRKVTEKALDCHLMIINPEKYVKRFAEAGADIITVHYEACGNQLQNTLSLIKATGKKCGVAINPDTPFDSVKKIIPDCDFLLIMSVYPGFGGQKFIPEILRKIREAKEFIETGGYKTEIEVDGGVTELNAKEIAEAGASVLVAGSTVFGKKDRAAVIAEMKRRNKQ